MVTDYYSLTIERLDTVVIDGKVKLPFEKFSTSTDGFDADIGNWYYDADEVCKCAPVGNIHIVKLWLFCFERLCCVTLSLL